MIPLWAAGFGAFLGFCAGIWLEFFKTSRDDFRELCREFAKLVTDAADVGSEFWLARASEPKAQLLLARLNGFQTRIDGYLTILFGRLDDESYSDVEEKAADFLRKLTGADPDDPDREPSRETAYAVQDASGTLIVALRRAVHAKINFNQRIQRWAGKQWPDRARRHEVTKNSFSGDRR